MTKNGPSVAEAKAALEAAGYVVVKAKSYRQAQERQRVAEALRAAEQEHRESTERWVRTDLIPQKRHMTDRCAFLYGVARAHGATDKDLS